MKKILLPLLLLLSIGMYAQKGQLKGSVINNEGKAAELVTIQLKEINKVVATDEKGEFIITDIQPNTYTLIASFVGFKTLEKKITIQADKTTGISLELFENDELWKEIVVKGYINANEKIVSVGKIAIKPMDLPQSIAVIDRQVLENQQVKNMSDVLANTNGVYIMGTAGGYQEEIAGRGFSFNSSNTFKNGVRYFNGMLIDFTNIEKVEIMKGSSAILFGNVAAGGVLNLVTKKPKFENGGEVRMNIGSFGLLKPSIDIYGGIGKQQKVAFRLNTAYETANSFREGVGSERFYVNPTLFFKLGQKTELLLEADYAKDERTPDFGAGIINYKIIALPRERFLGVAWSNYKATQLVTTAKVTHTFSPNWKLDFLGAYRQYETDLFANTRPNAGVAVINKEGTWIRNIQRTQVADTYYLGQLDLTGKFNTGKINHQVLLGTDTEQFETQTTAYNPLVRYDTINVFGTKKYKIRTDIPNLTPATRTDAPVTRAGVYIQDLIHVNQYIKLLAGVRYTYQKTGSDVLNYATNQTASSMNEDGAFSPKLGLVIQPNKKMSLFGSYTNSFVLNTGVDVGGNALKPSLVDQIEVGIKNQLLDNKLSINLTAYQIVNGNFAQTSLVNANTYTYIKELAGKVASTGVEVDFVTRPIPNLSLIAGYSYNETKYVTSNTYIAGSLLKYNPNHTANMSANYGFSEGNLKGLQLGVTSVYIGDRQAGRSTRIQVANDAYQLVLLPAYTQIDGTVGYTYKKASFRVKIGNLLDTYSYNVHDDNSVNPIAPRNFLVGLGYKF
jgi:iron complex outermembrane recepter protein